jgi:UDP-GlcNAc:undecaprenyl-phosphate GlcNAc-1-phosphate transferase
MSPRTAVVVAAGTGLAAASTLVLTEAARRVALRLGLTDRPAPHKAHARPTPYLGGVALVVGSLLPAALLARPWNTPFVTVVAGGVVVAGLGLVDDIKTLSPLTRLVVEAFAATAVVFSTRPLAVSGVFWPDLALTAAWIVVLTNSFNLLDNIDAAAASVAAATAGVLGLAALLAGRVPVAVLLWGLAGACVGFLAHNRPPARIFMGDAGSIFIGFVIAATALLLTPPAPANAYPALLLVTFVATVDTTLVLVHRKLTGRSWLSGGTDHISHRLRRLGLSTGWVAAVLAVVAACASALGVLVAGRVVPGWPTLVAAVLGVAGSVSLLLMVPVREPSRPAPRPS